MKKLVLAGVLTSIFMELSLAHLAYAHFLVEDTKTGLQASFHITPDHSPIAGKPSIISFDFAKTGVTTTGYSYSLKVKPTKGDAVNVPIDIPGNVVIGTYTFPSQGFYDIILTATHQEDGTVSTLQYGQRVSRGVTLEEDQTLKPIEIGAIAGTVLVAVIAIIFSVTGDNKRKGKGNDTKNHK